MLTRLAIVSFGERDEWEPQGTVGTDPRPLLHRREDRAVEHGGRRPRRGESAPLAPRAGALRRDDCGRGGELAHRAARAERRLSIDRQVAGREALDRSLL